MYLNKKEIQENICITVSCVALQKHRVAKQQ